MQQIRTLILLSMIVSIGLIIASCSNGGERSLTSNTSSQVSAIAYDENGHIDTVLTNQLTVSTNSENGSDRDIVVSINTQQSIKNSYIEFKYNPALEHPVDVSFGGFMKNTGNLVITSAALNHIGIIPIAQVAVGESISAVTGSGTLFTVKLTNQPFERSVSNFSQGSSDPIVQDRVIDDAKSTLAWTCVFRGDSGLNYLIDFADFGKVGANYGKQISANATSEPSDCDNKGKVDFADFGVIGSGYSQKITGWMIWTSDKNDIDPSKEAADNTLTMSDPSLTISDSKRGFKAFSFDLTKDPAYVKGTTKYYFIAPLGIDGKPMLNLGNGESTYLDPNKLYEPQNVWATNGDDETQINVYWSTPSGGVTPEGYNIYRSTLELGTYSKIGSVEGVSTNSYSDASVPDNSVYWYKIKCYAGTNESAYSTAAWGSKSVKGVLPPELPWATSDSYDKVSINWSLPAKGETPEGYYIFRSDLELGTYTQIGKTVGSSTLTYDDTTVTAGITYWYKLKSYKSSWPDSKYSYAFTGYRKELLPQPPENCWAGNDSYDQIDLHWDTPGSGMKPTGYRIYRSDLEAGPYVALGDVDATTFIYTDKTTTPKVTYWYKVTTLADKLESKIAESTAFWGIRKELLPEQPESVWATQDTYTDKVTINWSKPSVGMLPEGYKIYRSDLFEGTYLQIGSVLGADTSNYDDTTVTPGTHYYYKVQSYKGALSSDIAAVSGNEGWASKP